MNFKESRAIYLQIADRICDDILLGQYEEEGRISSVREYASECKYSDALVRVSSVSGSDLQ
mgnify:CR=1 FL=1